MANDVTKRPWILDTVANPILPALPATAGKRGPVHTTGFVFRDYTNGTASQAEFSDSRGIVIARLIGNAAQTPVGELWLVPIPVYGLALTAIDSGVVEVIVR